MTSGNHSLYEELEQKLARFFDAPDALLVGSGYVTNLVVAQAMAGNFSHALLDERAHVSLQDAARFLECPVMRFKNQDIEDLSRCVGRCGPGARLILLTDGLFAHDGSVAPLKGYLETLSSDALMLVDDAHGAGVLGVGGKGSLEHAGIGRRRVIQTITLSKAFGTYGGAILGSKALRRWILSRSMLFTGSTPIPLPLANAAKAAVSILSGDKSLRDRLCRNSARVKNGLRLAGFPLPETPGPIIGLAPPDESAAQRLRRALLQAGVFPPSIVYPNTSARSYFRFAISSEHTAEQLDTLQQTLVKAGLAGWLGMG
jgi:7-keto-8-aminopelargonate synthetase-like enzyme